MHNQIMKQISTTAPNTRKVVQGFQSPDRGPPTESELEGVMFLRIISGNSDPRVTLRAVWALRKALLDT